jgi:cellulose synthase/poly-beta-1,6-N-acetylglucosamine synthase-like glycosyltransferase
MDFLKDGFIYTGLFVALYFQIFLFLTYVGWRKDKNTVPGFSTDEQLPSVSIMVPCFNEATTVIGTVESLLALRYPTEKLKILVIDDGSTDATWQVVQKYTDNPQVVLIHKKNDGSKFAALNHGLLQVDTEIIGCLDADSRVDSESLRHSVAWFSRDDVYAVVPSMVIDSPQTVMQYMQKVEYEISTYLRQVLHMIESLYIAPGPLTLFRKTVFDTLGPYKEAHHTEDLEIALRMQSHNMRLVHASQSLVYTHGPKTWPLLLKQRIRWTYGFIKNIIDYKKYLFTLKFGDLSFFILPLSVISLVLIVGIFPFLVINAIGPLVRQVIKLSVVGIQKPSFHVDIFSVPTDGFIWLGFATLFFMVFALLIGRRFILKQKIFSFDLLTLFIYPYFASWWTLRSIWNAIRSKKSAWR